MKILRFLSFYLKISPIKVLAFQEIEAGMQPKVIM